MPTTISATCQRLKSSFAYSVWSSALYSLELSILKFFECRECSFTGNSTKDIFDMALSSAETSIALAKSFDENHSPNISLILRSVRILAKILNFERVEVSIRTIKIIQDHLQFI